MAKSLSNIIPITATEISITSIDSYFRNIALIYEFESEDTDPNIKSEKTFSSDGYEVYETIDAVAEIFEETSLVYKWAADAFAQKVNSGVNGSTFEKLIVIQKLSTDATYEAALNRVDYKDAYWNLPITDTVAEVQSVYAWVGTKYMRMLTQDDSANILDSGDSTDIASVLKAATATRASVWYHASQTEGLVSAMAAILSTSNPGDKAAFYKTPSGITVDSSLTSTQETTLEGKYANYFSTLQGTAGTYNSDSLTFNGVGSDNEKIQKGVQTDRIVLTLQSRGMDVLKRDIPYDNRGASELEGELKNVLEGFQVNEIIKEQFFENREGDLVNGFWVNVVDLETTRTGYPDQYAAQTFVVQIDYLLALTAEKITIDIEFST